MPSGFCHGWKQLAGDISRQIERGSAPAGVTALIEVRRLIGAISICGPLLWTTAALAQTAPAGWNGTWAGGWDRGIGVQLVFAGDQLVAFYWRGDYQDVRHASAGRGNKRFAWDDGEATVTRTAEGAAQLIVREKGKPDVSISLDRE